MAKDPNAVALGKKGGSRNTPAQTAARARNMAKNPGPPFKYRLVGDELQTRDGDRWLTLEPPYTRAGRAFLRRHKTRKS